MQTTQKKQILVRVKPELRKALRQLAVDNDVSLQVIVEQVLERYIKERT